MTWLWLARHAPYPPLTGGDFVYSRSFLHYVAQQTPVRALVFSHPKVVIPANDPVTYRQLPFKPPSKVASLLSCLPHVAFRHRQAAYLDIMREEARNAEVIVVDQIAMAFCVTELRKMFGPDQGPPIILINHNHEASLRLQMVRGVSNPLIRLPLQVDAWKAGRLERQANRAANGFTAITTTDLDAFYKDAPDRPGLLVMPGYDGQVLPQRQITADVPPRISIIGGRAAFHKRLVLNAVLEALKTQNLQQRYIIDIVGAIPDKETLAVLEKRFPGFNFVGYVDDLKSYLETCRIGLVPDEFGGGFKLRALSHIYLRTPMLALTRAFDGMTLRENIDFLGAGSMDELVRRIPDVIDDLELLNRIQNTAFDYCAHRFLWEQRAGELIAFGRRLREGVSSSAAGSP